MKDEKGSTPRSIEHVFSKHSVSTGSMHLWQSLRILERHHPPEPHYYLMLLGVHPNFQRKGYARALLEALHARSEAHPTSIGVYLETAKEQNVALYKYFGYHLKTQVNINGVENFIMFRPNFRKEK
jgi:ribosomal protein S18 acetylase RimI-like enzyme